MIFTHSGNAGDVIYSIPTINHLCNGERKAIIYIKEAWYDYSNQYETLKELLLLQPCIKEVRSFIPKTAAESEYFQWRDLKYDYDLDSVRKGGSREQLQRGRIHIVKRYFDAFNITGIDHRLPFLNIDDAESLKHNEEFALIHVTKRWNGFQYDWKKIYLEALGKYGKVYLTGFVSEYLDFTIRYAQIEHIATENMLEVARLVRDCKALYCNQNPVLTLAQGLGKEYFLVMNGCKTNCHLYTPNEHLLGREYLMPNHTFDPASMPDSHLIKYRTNCKQNTPNEHSL